jgi:hypothetical protein
LQKTARDLVDKARRDSKDPVTVSSIAAVPGATDGQQFVRVLATQNEVDVVDRDGTVVFTDPKKALALNVVTTWKGNRWWIYDIG